MRNRQIRRKTGGAKRVLVNLRALNKYIVSRFSESPTFGEIIGRIKQRGQTFVSILNVRCAFFEVDVSTERRKYLKL